MIDETKIFRVTLNKANEPKDNVKLTNTFMARATMYGGHVIIDKQDINSDTPFIARYGIGVVVNREMKHILSRFANIA